MPTTPSSGYSFASLGGQPLVSSMSALTEFDKHGWDSSMFAGKANSFISGVGEVPGRGWVLMPRVNLNELNTSEPHMLEFGIGESDNSIQLSGVYIRSARRISPGKSHGDEAIYLLDLVDTRYYLRRKKCNRHFNCLTPGETSGDYVTETTNAGVPWTWTQVLTELWDEVETAFPTLIGSIGTVPDITDMTSKPENLRYEGVSAWEALNDACRRCGCAVVYDNVYADNFYIVRLGRIGSEAVPQFHSQGGTNVTKAGVTTVFISAGDTTRPLNGDDGLFIDEEVLQGDSMMPQKIVVMFPTCYGSSQMADELTSQYGKWYPCEVDGSNSTFLPSTDQCEFYDSGSGRIPRPTFCPGSERIVYDLARARFSAVGDTDPANKTALQTRAKEIARDIYRTLVDCAGSHVAYAGIHFDDDSNPTIPGKTVSEVSWGDFGTGFRTDISREPPMLLPTSPPQIDLPSAGIQLFHAVIIEACNSACSTYRVQRVHRYLRDLCSDCGSGSGSGS